MSESMVERVARKIEAKLGELTSDDYTLDYLRPSGELASVEVARAAIEAMREPTEEVYQAGREVAMGKPGTLDSVKERWKAMIDAALTPAKVDEAGWERSGGNGAIHRL